MYYCDLNQKEAESVLKKEGITALLPIGAVEVHGNHLPLDTDCRLAKGVAEKVSHKLGGDPPVCALRSGVVTWKCSGNDQYS